MKREIQGSKQTGLHCHNWKGPENSEICLRTLSPQEGELEETSERQQVEKSKPFPIFTHKAFQPTGHVGKALCTGSVHRTGGQMHQLPVCRGERAVINPSKPLP